MRAALSEHRRSIAGVLAQEREVIAIEALSRLERSSEQERRRLREHLPDRL
jgi:hypothetical protein